MLLILLMRSKFTSLQAYTQLPLKRRNIVLFGVASREAAGSDSDLPQTRWDIE